jgi:hypothetical protein
MRDEKKTQGKKRERQKSTQRRREKKSILKPQVLKRKDARR